MITQFTATRATDRSFMLAESPVWDSRRQRVMWVDITAGEIWDGELTGSGIIPQTTHHFEEMIGAAVPISAGGILAAGEKQFHAIGNDDARYTSNPIIGPGLNSRLNDGSCDPAGRFFVGSMSLDDTHKNESLYMLDPQGRTSVVDGGLSLSNGIAWSPDGSEMYHIDTVEKTLWRIPYDVATGNPGERVVVLNREKLAELFPENAGAPDGLTVDNAGNLWVAYWGAGRVRCHDPVTGEVRASVTVPAPNTTSSAFVGPRRDKLLITTAREHLSEQELADFPDSGHLFIAEVGATGFLRAPWAGEAGAIAALI